MSTRTSFLTRWGSSRGEHAANHVTSFREPIAQAHERSLQTDILCGLVLRAQRRRAPDSPLRVVVMSATLDVALFQHFFDPPVACVRVPGRQHAVQVLYAVEPEDDYVDAALCTTMQIHDEQAVDGDILVFMPGQEQIEALAQ